MISEYLFANKMHVGTAAFDCHERWHAQKRTEMTEEELHYFRQFASVRFTNGKFGECGSDSPRSDHANVVFSRVRI